MKILYFANIKQGIGKSEDIIKITKSITILKVIEKLKIRGENYKIVFSDMNNIKCSLNYDFVGLNEIVCNEDELAFFPPVTGG